MNRYRFLIYFLSFSAALSIASDRQPSQGNSRPIGALLNPDGSLNLKSGYSGSLDPKGYKMVLKADGSPLFVPRSKPMAVPPSPSAPGDENWSSQFILPGVNDQVLAIAQYGSNVYLGGFFTVAGNINAYCIVKWDGSTWTDFANLEGSAVYALAVDGSGNLYAGGSFTKIGGVNASNIARYDRIAQTWSPLGGGVDIVVFTIATTGGSDVYAGGIFFSAGGVSANNIARWDGSAWNRLGSELKNGVNSTVNSIVVNGTDVYIGGDFTVAYNAASDLTVNCITKWDGTSFSQLGSGASGSPVSVKALAMVGTNVYAGGDFSSIGGVAASNIAKWNGSGWSALGTGTNNTVNSILAESSSSIYAGGAFSTAGGLTRNFVAQWNGSSWLDVGGGVNSPVSVIAGSFIYVGGTFRIAGTIGASYAARWNSTSSSWENVGPATANGIEKNGSVNAIAVDGSNVYVGGTFEAVGKLAVNNIAKWNGSSWSALPPTGENGVKGGGVNAIAVLGSNVYVGGAFTSAGGLSAQRIARFDGSLWSSLHPGLNGTVYAIGIKDATLLYAGGSFTKTNDEATTLNYIAGWNGSIWSAVGTGTDISGGTSTSVNAIAVYNDNVFVGGDFTSPGNYVAWWNGSAWSPLGSGTNGTNGIVHAAEMDGSNLLVGGEFTQAGGGSAKHIARWNGSAWSSVGSGTNDGTDGTVYAIRVSSGVVYAAGFFSNAGTTSADNLAKYESGTWSAYGSGTNAQINAIGLGSLYAGGEFTSAGGKYSYYFAKYSDATASTVFLETKVLLEGPYNSDLNAMSTSLNTNGSIPLRTPEAYRADDDATVSSIPSDVTDWVLVQLRTTPSGSAVLSKSVFVYQDGRIVDRDGTIGKITLEVGEGDYYIVIKHRNHLAVMSAGALHLIPESSTLHDFSAGSGRFYGTGGAKEVKSGVWGMWAGDVNQDKQITTMDYTSWYNSARAGESGYKDTDVNMDVQVTTMDYTAWYNNARVGASSQVP